MGKLRHVQAALQRQPSAPAVDFGSIRDQVAAMVAVALSDVRKQVAEALAAEVAKMHGSLQSAIKGVAADLQTHSAGSHVDVTKRLDDVAAKLSKAVEQGIAKASQGYSDLRGVVAAESDKVRRSMPSIPKQVEVDLSGVFDDLQWIKTFLAMKKDPEPPKPAPPAKMPKGYKVVRSRITGLVERMEAEY